MITIIFVFLFLAVLLYLLAVKRQLKNIKEELEKTRQQSYNKQLTVSLFDRDLTALAKEINYNLDYQKGLKLKTEQSERKFRQSISDVAHDLRTPLTVIKGNLQMLNRHNSLTEQEQMYLNICQDKAETLKCMVDDFFDMAVLESDAKPVPLSEVDITSMLAGFVVDHEAVIRGRNLEPEIQLPERSILVKADESMLSRMLNNLLNNVLKYAKERFRISLEEQDTGCLITFANAISSDTELHIEHVFDRTYRGDGARQDSGAGLGLYIVKLLAEKQGMKVFAEREDMQLRFHIFVCKTGM